MAEDLNRTEIPVEDGEIQQGDNASSDASGAASLTRSGKIFTQSSEKRPRGSPPGSGNRKDKRRDRGSETSGNESDEAVLARGRALKEAGVLGLVKDTCCTVMERVCNQGSPAPDREARLFAKHPELPEVQGGHDVIAAFLDARTERLAKLHALWEARAGDDDSDLCVVETPRA